MDNILRMTISNSLRFSQSNQPIDLHDIPNNTFGVFVSIERSKLHQLDKWPINIHGCIGYWDPNYQVLDNNIIIQKIMEVAADATWKDSRRNYFPHSIYVDLDARFKIYFMTKPVYKINNKTGIVENTSEFFDNNKHGLIVENTNDQLLSQRATYLPKVFPNETWNYIKESLINKANIDQENVNFFAYKCVTHSMTIADYFMIPIQKFVNTFYKTFIPYSVSNNIIVVDKTEDVRNLATIYDILQMQKHGYQLNDQVNNAIINNINYYKSKYISNKNAMRQSSAFLLLDLYLIDPTDKYIDIIMNELFSQINSNSLIDINFELGEILMALSIVDSNNSNLKNKINKIPQIDQDSESELDIFRYNWFSKLVNKINNNEYKYQLINRVIGFIKDNQSMNETNYYAVEFEALSTLYASIDNQQIRLQIEPYLIKLMLDLEKRRNELGLYQFSDKSSRLDITGHVLNGFFSLLMVK